MAHPLACTRPPEASDVTITPLKKRRIDGRLYARDPRVEALLAELAALSRDELIERAAVSRRTDPHYIPSECLVYFLRGSRNDCHEAWFERLYRHLIERVRRCLPRPDSADGRTASFSEERVRDEAFGRFVEILAADRVAYTEKLDYFEIRFDGALASLRRDARVKAWRDAKRFEPLEVDDESGEFSAEVEATAGTYDPFAEPDLDVANYRLRLNAAIDALPPDQRRIIHMLRKGSPIDSKEPGAVTIAKALGRSEKTIRTYRDKAFVALRAALRDGENQ